MTVSCCIDSTLAKICCFSDLGNIKAVVDSVQQLMDQLSTVDWLLNGTAQDVLNITREDSDGASFCVLLHLKITIFCGREKNSPC